MRYFHKCEHVILRVLERIECATLPFSGTPEYAKVFANRSIIFAAGVSLILLQACATTPPAGDSAATKEKAPIPELNLNLPDESAGVCDCTPEVDVDYVFLDKGISALVGGDHREAVNYFRRYQRLESSPAADWEAGIAVAYDKMLPQSPYYNWRAARESYLRLVRNPPQGVTLHPQVILMRDSLAIFSELHWQKNELQKENDIVSENLEKREEALKRLRELTLGQ
jgi:tetratricopeptide (TPR) repeat protein